MAFPVGAVARFFDTGKQSGYINLYIVIKLKLFIVYYTAIVVMLQTG